MLRASRLRRVSPERVYELARHLTERDRMIAVTLYQQRILTTEQLQLLFFSSRRRAQDRLLFLYRHRVIDRFYPPLRFGQGKAAAHWLLDEAGAILVAGRLGVERKKLRWQRRDDWASHPQLAHQLECNRFVTDLVNATLATPDLGVYLWWSSARAAARLNADQRNALVAGGRVVPDTAFLLATPAGGVECVLEWDRGTETRAQLAGKLDLYNNTEATRRTRWRLPYSVLLVVPGPGRVETLRRAYQDARADCSDDSRATWPRLVSTVPDLQQAGPLGRVWWPINPDSSEGPFTLSELPAAPEWAPLALDDTLGRCWRKDAPGFWDRLSPLGREPSSAPSVPLSRRVPGGGPVDLHAGGIDGSMDDPDANDNDEREEVVSW